VPFEDQFSVSVGFISVLVPDSLFQGCLCSHSLRRQRSRKADLFPDQDGEDNISLQARVRKVQLLVKSVF
jgi:hypothetical protein